MNHNQFPAFFSKAMKICYTLREDVHDQISAAPLDSHKKQINFALWWLANAPNEYPKHFQLNKALTDLANEVIEIRFDQPITRFMKFLLEKRKDIQSRFHIESKANLESFFGWFYIHGLKEYQLTDLVTEEQKVQLSLPYAICEDDKSRFPITRLMRYIWSYRDDLNKEVQLDNATGINWFIKWFYIRGCLELKLFNYLSLEEKARLNSSVQNLPQNSDEPISYLMYLLWAYDPQLNKDYHLNQSDDRSRYYQWFKGQGITETGLAPIKNHQHFDGPAQVKSSDLKTPIKQSNPHQSNLPAGVNLVGYATGNLGIGEDVRMMVTCLKHTNIPFCVINHKPASEISQTDESITEYFSEVPQYNTTILCLTGLETMHLWLKFPELFEGKYVIGYWPWELPKWPEKWYIAYSTVDEIWASSRYTQQAYRNSKIPVQYMPMTVTAQKPKKYLRQDFNLPKKHFLFLFVFDFMSYPLRKNPQACIESFKKAFPPTNDGVNLILKVSNVQKNSSKWQSILDLASSDHRIIIIDETYSRHRTMGLFQQCDAYLSLHRCEGFGRTMAEAILMNKPVIATNFSGNTDFITEENAFPVNYRLIPIEKDQYPGWHGQSWADVDTDDAAKQLKKVYKNHKNGSNPIKIKLPKKYQAEKCASKYAKRLKNIWQIKNQLVQ